MGCHVRAESPDGVPGDHIAPDDAKAFRGTAVVDENLRFADHRARGVVWGERAKVTIVPRIAPGILVNRSMCRVWVLIIVERPFAAALAPSVARS